jgi:hypothetical protein
MKRIKKSNPARSKRDQTIVGLRAQGKTTNEIAKTVGVTQGRISQILSDEDIKKELDNVHRMYASKAQEISTNFLDHCMDKEDKTLSLNAIKEYHKVMGISPSNVQTTFISNIYQQNNVIPQESLSMLKEFFGTDQNLIDLLPGE